MRNSESQVPIYLRRGPLSLPRGGNIQPIFPCGGASRLHAASDPRRDNPQGGCSYGRPCKGESLMHTARHSCETKFITEVSKSMARISGVDLPRDKRIEIGLTYIYGITMRTSRLPESKLAVADNLNFSTSSLMLRSFSIYVLVEAMKASG